MSEVSKAAAVTPPVPGSNIIVRASVASAERIKIPDAWRRGWVTIEADGVDVYFGFGGSTVAVDSTGTTTLSSEEVSAYDGGECSKIPSGAEKAVDLSQIQPVIQDLYISHVESGTGGYFRMTLTSGLVNGY